MWRDGTDFDPRRLRPRDGAVTRARSAAALAVER
jgi:hypothetical protein